MSSEPQLRAVLGAGVLLCTITGVMAAGYGGVCSATSDCTATSNLECRYPVTRVSGCTLKQCLCASGYTHRIIPGDVCVPLLKNDDTCTVIESYKCPGLLCSSTSGSLKCACPSLTTSNSAKTACVLDVATITCSIGGRCGYMNGDCGTSNTNCIEEKGLICSNRKCVCRSGYEYSMSGTVCIPKTTETQCSIPSDTCYGNGDFTSSKRMVCNCCEKCVCPYRYERHSQLNYCVPVLNADCSGGMSCDASMSCINNRCVCATGFVFVVYAFPVYCISTVGVTQNVAAGGVCSPTTPYKLCAAGLTCKNCGEDSALYRCVAEDPTVAVAPCPSAAPTVLTSVSVLSVAAIVAGFTH